MAIQVGTDGNEVINGTNGDDLLVGDNGSNVINGSDGADTLIGDGGGDTIFGGDGDNVIRTDGAGSDIDSSDRLDNILTDITEDVNIIEGTDGKDTLTGSKEDDLIFGQEDDDILEGGEGTDILSGGAGNDTLSGVRGNNVFALALDEGIDTIEDFSGGDQILIEQEAFAFDATSPDQFTYEEDTGELFFEASTEGAEPVQIATLPINLGSTFNAEEDIVFDEAGIVNGMNSQSADVSSDRRAFMEDFLTSEIQRSQFVNIRGSICDCFSVAPELKALEFTEYKSVR